MQPARRLLVQLGAQVVLTIELTTSKINIGRLPDNALPLAGMRVADRHAELRQEIEGFVLIDLGSAFGTLLDGVRLLPNQPYLLKDGSSIQIDLFLLTYRAEESARAAAAPARRGPTAEPPPDRAPVPRRLARQSRPTFEPQSVPPDAPSAYLRYLPVIFSDDELGGSGDTLRKLLLIVESILEPIEQRQEQIEMYFGPQTCPASFLPWLASWFDVRISPDWPEARVRALLAALIELYRWRGTEYGLTQVIQVCTGVTPTIMQNAAEPFVLHITCRLPQDDWADRKLLEELIEAHKPAHAGYVLETPE